MTRLPVSARSDYLFRELHLARGAVIYVKRGDLAVE